MAQPKRPRRLSKTNAPSGYSPSPKKEQPKGQTTTRKVRVDRRATGWRLPMIFCGVVIVLVIIVGGWRYINKPADLPIASDLLTVAGNSIIDLELDPEGQAFKKELTDAGTGFTPKRYKDEMVTKVAHRALGQGRVDVAVVASQLIRDHGQRTGLLKSIANTSLNDCATLPWAVFAARNLKEDRPLALTLTERINARWEQCGRSTGTPTGLASGSTDAGNVSIVLPSGK